MNSPFTVINNDLMFHSNKLFDFTSLKSLDEWTEISDTVRTVGKSKATLVLQVTDLFRNAVFFTLLHPQPNGAGFAGVRIPVTMNLSNYRKISIRCRGEGENSRYKIVLKHNGQTSRDDTTYEHIFTVKVYCFYVALLSMNFHYDLLF